MKNILETVRSLRQLKSLIGIGKKEFELLLEVFTEVLEEQRTENYRSNRSNRSRRPGGGRKSKLSNPSDKLFFILCYLKTYPTFEVLGFMFNLNPSKASENVKKLLPILKQSQSKLNLLPLRKLKGKSDLESLLETDCETPELTNSLKVSEPQSDKIAVSTPEKEILIDVTEREHFRHQKPLKQKKQWKEKNSYGKKYHNF